jgi:hypothetical protein
MTIAVMSIEQGSIVTSLIEKSADWEVEYGDSRLLKYANLTKKKVEFCDFLRSHVEWRATQLD